MAPQLKFIEEMAPGRDWSDGPRGAIDEFLSATSEESMVWADRLAAEEGLLVGYLSIYHL